MSSRRRGIFSLILNIVWMFTFGLVSAIFWLLGGIILCITIIGIPFGKQCFKCARLSLAPFGKKVDINYFKHPIINTVWLIFLGWELFLAHLIGGLIVCVFIVTIPIGIQIMKFGKLGLAPFGAKIK